MTEPNSFKANFLGIKRSFTWTGLISGLLVVFVSTTGPIAILYQAAAAGKLSDTYTNSWLFAVFLGSGLFGIYLTLKHGMPIIGSWASTTTALLVTGLVDHKYSEVIGAYFIASVILIIVGVTGLFEKIMKLIPNSIIMAMLAGVLITFGLRIFTSTKVNPLLGITMFFAYFLSRTIKFKAPVLAVFATGLLITILQSNIQKPLVDWKFTTPVWVNPSFSFGALFTLAIPIFLTVMTTQNAPGIALLKAIGYQPPINKIVSVGGWFSFIGAGFGGAGVNISAMTATIAISPDADPNPNTRYFSGIVSGLAYSVAALFAGVISSLYRTFPIELTSILAGIALLPIIINSIYEAISDSDFRDSAVVTFLITMSGISGWGIGAPFWGIIGGVAVHQFAKLGKGLR
jgi:benzoate membrane transport protein